MASPFAKKSLGLLKLYLLVFAIFIFFGILYLMLSISFISVCAAVFFVIIGVVLSVLFMVIAPFAWKPIYGWFKKGDTAFGDKQRAISKTGQYSSFVRTANFPHFVIFIILFFVVLPASSVVLLVAFYSGMIGLLVGLCCAVPLIILGIAAPAMAWISFIHSRDKLEPEPEWALLVAFTWGMLSCIPALFINSMNGIIFEVALGVTGVALSAGALTAVLSAPVFEEGVKAFGFVFIRHEVDNELDGLVYGICFGVGFATIENFAYAANALASGGTIGFLFTSMFRGVFTVLLHIMGPAMIGFAYGWAKRNYKRGFDLFLPVAGAYMFGMLNHSLWNLMASIPMNICLGLGITMMQGLCDLVLLMVLIVVATRKDREMYELHRGDYDKGMKPTSKRG